jgi:hypothetical protein
VAYSETGRFVEPNTTSFSIMPFIVLRNRFANASIGAEAHDFITRE